jgi:DNA-directed RNA polymerase subunit beta
MKNIDSKKVMRKKVEKRKGLFFLSAQQEKNLILASGDCFEKDNKNKITLLKQSTNILIKKDQNFLERKPLDIDFVSPSKTQMISIATSLIPFLQHNDANRALMGSNMQRQAIPLKKKDICLIETGIEKQIGKESESTLIARKSGIVKYASSKKIILLENKTSSKKNLKQSFIKKVIKRIGKNVNSNNEKYTETTYHLENRRKSNQNTYLHQTLAIKKNQWIKKEQILADGASTINGSLSLGKNLLIGYMGWEGYNFEDAVVINKKLVDEDILTSIHIKKYKTFLKNTENGEV